MIKKGFPENDKEKEVFRDWHQRFSLSYYKLKDTDVGSDGAGHERTFETSRSKPSCSAGGSRVGAKYQRAIRKDHCLTSEGKATTSFSLLTKALS